VSDGLLGDNTGAWSLRNSVNSCAHVVAYLVAFKVELNQQETEGVDIGMNRVGFGLQRLQGTTSK
jgi:hypothetical protein